MPYAIVGAGTGAIIGVCTDPQDVLAEEPPETRFILISQAEFDTLNEWTPEQESAVLAREKHRFARGIQVILDPASARMVWLMGLNHRITDVELHAASLSYWEEKKKRGKPDKKAYAIERYDTVRQQLYARREELTQWVIDHPAPPLPEENADALPDL